MTERALKDLVKYILVSDIPISGVETGIEPDERDVKLLNAFMPEDIELVSFKARLHMQFLPGEKILHIVGDIYADIKTQCSISLKPMEIHIEEEIDVDFCQKIYEDDGKDETYLLPEKITNGRIDVYEVALETLLLSLPTHPTLENASIDDLGYKPKAIDLVTEDEKPNPFAILQSLKEDK